MKKVKLCLSLLFTVCLFVQAPPSATQYLFIFDASGSMWQKMENEYKITIAKKVMKDLVNQLPDDSRIGLIAYGHTREGDCNDIETLVPLGVADKTLFNSKVDALNPKGKTPISLSVNQALALLRTETGHTTIILISDGLETCEGNACETVKNAKAGGVNITMHVIGFGIVEADIADLECLAQAGGGQYLPAANAQELNDVLQQVTVEPIKEGGYLSIQAVQNGALIDATVKVFKKGESKPITFGRTYTGKETNPRILLLPEGSYFAEVTSVRMEGYPMILLPYLEVKMNDTLNKVADFAKGTLNFSVTCNGVLTDALVQLYNAGTKISVSNKRTYMSTKSNPVVMEVLPGFYDVVISTYDIKGQPDLRFDNQLIKANEVLSLSHNFSSGILKVGAKQGTALIDATVEVFTPKSGKSSVASGRTYISSNSNPKTIVLVPGNYEVRLNPVKPKGLSPKSFNVTVKENGTTEVQGDW